MMKIKSRFALKRGVLLDLKICGFGWERGVFLAQNPRKWCIFQAWVRAWYTFWSGVGAGLNCSQYDDDEYDSDYPSKISEQPPGSLNGQIISSHTLLGIWLLIHAGQLGKSVVCTLERGDREISSGYCSKKLKRFPICTQCNQCIAPSVILTNNVFYELMHSKYKGQTDAFSYNFWAMLFNTLTPLNQFNSLGVRRCWRAKTYSSKSAKYVSIWPYH